MHFTLNRTRFGVEYSSCFISVLNLDLHVCCFDALMSRSLSCGPNMSKIPIIVFLGLLIYSIFDQIYPHICPHLVTFDHHVYPHLTRFTYIRPPYVSTFDHIYLYLNIICTYIWPHLSIFDYIKPHLPIFSHIWWYMYHKDSNKRPGI